MNDEQKQRAQKLIAEMESAQRPEDEIDRGWKIAGLLEELIDAPEPEPVAKVMHVDGLNSNNLLDCDLPTGTLLYTAPQPPKLSDERILELTHGCAPNLILDPILFARAIEREILGE